MAKLGRRLRPSRPAFLGGHTERHKPEPMIVELPAGAQGRELEADIVPVPPMARDQPGARATVTIVVTEDTAVYAALETAIDPTYEAVADLLAAAVRAVVERLDSRPRLLTVRHAGLVAPLTARLGALRVSVRAAKSLPLVDHAAADLRSKYELPPVINFPMFVATWQAWGLPDLAVMRLFQAGATYAQAAPWRFLQNAQTLVAKLPGGRVWHVCVLGNGGEQFGLGLYVEKADLDRHFQPGADWHNDPLAGTVLIFSLEPMTDLPPPMVREVRAKRWPLAGLDRVPTLEVYNAPWAGISAEQADDLAAVLRAVPAFVAGHETLLADARTPHKPVDWQDPLTGVMLTYNGLVGPGAGRYLWPTPAALAPCTARGPSADPEAAVTGSGDADDLEAGVEDWLARFAAWCNAKGITAKDVPSAASHFVADFLAGYQGVPLAAVTDLDLREFLYDWYPRKVAAKWRQARGMPAALATLFAFLADEGIVCPWAAGTLADEAAFKTRWDSCPGRAWWDRDIGTWRALLVDALDQLVLIPDPRLGRDDAWGGTVGIEEFGLFRELGRRWLLWRDEVIRGGTTAPPAVREQLIRRQRAWEQAKHKAHKGRSPIQVIRRERERG